MARGRDVHTPVSIDRDTRRRAEVHGELAVAAPRHSGTPVRREPQDQLPVRLAEARVAELGDEESSCGVEGAAVRLRLALGERGGRELADLRAIAREDPPAARHRGLPGVLAGDEAATAVGQRAHHAVHVAPACGVERSRLDQHRLGGRAGGSVEVVHAQPVALRPVEPLARAVLRGGQQREPDEDGESLPAAHEDRRRG